MMIYWMNINIRNGHHFWIVHGKYEANSVYQEIYEERFIAIKVHPWYWGDHPPLQWKYYSVYRNVELIMFLKIVPY